MRANFFSSHGLSTLASLLPVVLVTLAPGASTADTLERYFCYCRDDNKQTGGYHFEYEYTAERLGNKKFDIQTQCKGPLIKGCNADTELLRWVCDDRDGHKFCYNQEFFHGDKYKLDGKEKQLNPKKAHKMGGADKYCLEICKGPGIAQLDPVAKSQAEVFYDLPVL
ncbi:MAG: hypothetical protein M1831_003586 [Alyxoria varia]|nr:MAG: hypothetical protein M1831_003586 [Alyxoria varia]